MKYTKEEKKALRIAKLEQKIMPTEMVYLKEEMEKLDEFDYLAGICYQQYVESVNTVRWERIRALIAYTITVIFLVLSFFYPPIMISSVVFLVVATMEALNSRIDLVWQVDARRTFVKQASSEALDKMMERVHEHREHLNEEKE